MYTTKNTTKTLDLGCYQYREKHQGSDGYLYEWIEDMDALSNPIGMLNPFELAIKARALIALNALNSPSVEPSISNVLAITKLISLYYNLPWRLGYIILQHEGGVRKFRHPDGVMQTIDSARKDQIPRIPRALKLILLGLSLTDQTSDKQLNKQLHGEFRRRLTIQIAVGIQELTTALQRFNGYIALAFAAYNTGRGSITRLVTQKSAKRPRNITDTEWEEMCREAASLLHQPQSAIRVKPGVWLCDPRVSKKWLPRYGSRAYDKKSGRWLRGYAYLRSVRGSVPSQGPTSPCDWNTTKRVQSGSGELQYKTTRDGSLDKFYNPRKLSRAYYQAASAELTSISDDNLPMKVLNGRLVKIQNNGSVLEVSLPSPSTSTARPNGSMDQRYDPATHPWEAAIQLFGGRVVDPTKFSRSQAGFQQYLDATGVKYFSAKEITTPHKPSIAKRVGYSILLPKHEWWPRAATLAKLADSLRELVNRPVKMRNWWRPQDYNKAVKGAADSDHILAKGIDLDYRSADDRRQAEALLKRIRSEHSWLRMSLGLGSKTTHIGLLTKRGERTWLYKSYKR